MGDNLQSDNDDLIQCHAVLSSQEMLSQKKIIRLILNNPMTINELYKALPNFDERNIAPLVTQLKKEGYVFIVGKKPSRLRCGIRRKHDIYSSLEIHRPKDRTSSIKLLDSIFGVKRKVR